MSHCTALSLAQYLIISLAQYLISCKLLLFKVLALVHLTATTTVAEGTKVVGVDEY